MSREYNAASHAFYVQCSRCPVTSPLCITDSDAVLAAGALGWTVEGDEHEGDLCPVCVADLHKKEREV